MVVNDLSSILLKNYTALIPIITKTNDLGSYFLIITFIFPNITIVPLNILQELLVSLQPSSSTCTHLKSSCAGKKLTCLSKLVIGFENINILNSRHKSSFVEKALSSIPQNTAVKLIIIETLSCIMPMSLVLNSCMNMGSLTIHFLFFHLLKIIFIVLSLIEVDYY